jgi:hypothetical protein
MREGKAVRFTEHFDTVKLNAALQPEREPAPA